MKRRNMVLVAATTLIGVIVVSFLVARPRARIRYVPTDQDKQVAAACLQTVKVCTNEIELQPDDPRLPAVIKNLHPLSIELMPSRVCVIYLDDKDVPGEYHLSREGNSKTWVLYVVFPSRTGVEDHVEALRITSD